MKTIPPHNTFDNVKGMATHRVKEMAESKTKKLKKIHEHGSADLTSNDDKQLAKLKAQGRIRRIGPAKGGSWEAVGQRAD